MTMFSPYVTEKLGWYVYGLRNPIDHRVFYIGKGKGNRIVHHAQEALAVPVDGPDDTLMSPKLELIRSIHAAGEQVETFLIRYQLKSEKEAYEVEAAVIDVLRLLDENGDNQLFNVTNLILGHHHLERGLAPAHVAGSRFEAPPMPEVSESIVIFGIPKLWTPSMGDNEIYNAARGWWRLGERAQKATHAAAAHRNVIRGIYKIDYLRERVQGDRDWEEDLTQNSPRRGFVGRPAPEMNHLLHTSVKHIPVGGSIRYVNCGPEAPSVTDFYAGDAARHMAERDGFVP